MLDILKIRLYNQFVLEMRIKKRERRKKNAYHTRTGESIKKEKS